MEEPKRFQSQKLNSDDYIKTEEGAKVLKNSGIFFALASVVGITVKKYGPSFIESIRKLRKR